MQFGDVAQVKKFLGWLKQDNPQVTDRQWAETEELLVERLNQQPPPTVAIIGLAGVGKSSTINALFNAGVPVSHYEPCTRVAQPIEGDLFEYTGRNGTMIVYDMPGLGENLLADERHYEAYRQVLPTVDVVVWVIEAPSRVISPIEIALRRLRQDCGAGIIEKVVFAANKVDRIYPGEQAWIPQANMPSREQDQTIVLYTNFLRDALRHEVPSVEESVVCYSATRRYNLDILMEKIGAHAPDQRAWMLGRIAEVADFRDLVDPRMLAWIEANKRSRAGGPGGQW